MTHVFAHSCNFTHSSIQWENLTRIECVRGRTERKTAEYAMQPDNWDSHCSTSRQIIDTHRVFSVTTRSKQRAKFVAVTRESSRTKHRHEQPPPHRWPCVFVEMTSTKPARPLDTTVEPTVIGTSSIIRWTTLSLSVRCSRFVCVFQYLVSSPPTQRVSETRPRTLRHRSVTDAHERPQQHNE